MNHVARNIPAEHVPAYHLAAEEVPTWVGEGWPLMRFRAELGNDAVSVRGPLTNFNAGGKWYVDVQGTYQVAAAGVPYVHHEWDGARYAPLGLRFETGRMNALTNGWDVSVLANWGRTNMNPPDATGATFAGLTLRQLKETTANGDHFVTNPFTLVGNQLSYTILLRKSASKTKCLVLVLNGANIHRQWVDLAAGALLTRSTAGTAAGVPVIKPRADSVYMVTCTITGLAAGASSIRVYNADADNATTYVGTLDAGVNVGPVIVVDGANDVGSLIPAAGTRTVDSCTHSSAWLEPIKGGFQYTDYFTPNAATSTNDRYILDLRDGGNNGFAFLIDSATKLSVAVNSATVNLQSAALAWTVGATYKLTVRCVGMLWTLYRDDVSVASGTLTALTTYGATTYLGSDNAAGKLRNGCFLKSYAEAA